MKHLSYDEWIKQDSLCIMIDQQEKVNYHIKNAFDKMNIQYQICHLTEGDYKCQFNDWLVPAIIERKNSLAELSGNLSKHRDRFFKEFDKMKDNRKYLLIESDNLDNMLSGCYGTEFKPNSYIANFLLLEMRHNLHIHFVNKHNMALFMLKVFYYNYYTYMKLGGNTNG